MKTEKKKIVKEEDKVMDSEKFNAALKRLLKSPPIKKKDLKNTTKK